MTALYPPLEPYRQFTMAVDTPHTLYVEESGNPDGLPVVFLHGGPGAGCVPDHRRLFDPERYRIILFDQRGAGQSRPHAELADNTTQALVGDIETIREHLGIEKWLVFGGSWGSTLGLVYAETHPERVTALIVRGIFLCRPQDIQWFYQHGASRIFPDYWQDYLAPVAEAERTDMVSAYYRLLTDDNPQTRLNAAKAWSIWEGRTLSLSPCNNAETIFSNPHLALSLARIECHYFMHNSFLDDNQILRDAHRLKSIPGIIVHGRYDIICPIDNAFALHQAWPGAEFRIIDDAGHAVTETGIRDALLQATDDFAERFA
jgi:proline iminopeptidase